jgi:hypothetical protein
MCTARTTGESAGQYADFEDANHDDTLPPTHFRAPNTPSLAYSPTTNSLLFVYQNNINRPTSQADISLPDLHRRRAELVGRGLPVNRFIRPARHQRPVLPVGRIG